MFLVKQALVAMYSVAKCFLMISLTSTFKSPLHNVHNSNFLLILIYGQSVYCLCEVVGLADMYVQHWL